MKFKKSDIITLTQKLEGGWWEGTLGELPKISIKKNLFFIFNDVCQQINNVRLTCVEIFEI